MNADFISCIQLLLIFDVYILFLPSHILQFREKLARLRENVIIVYLTHECINRYLFLITNADASIHINESSPKRTRLGKRY